MTSMHPSEPTRKQMVNPGRQRKLILGQVNGIENDLRKFGISNQIIAQVRRRWRLIDCGLEEGKSCTELQRQKIHKETLSPNSDASQTKSDFTVVGITVNTQAVNRFSYFTCVYKNAKQWEAVYWQLSGLPVYQKPYNCERWHANYVIQRVTELRTIQILLTSTKLRNNVREF